VTKRVTKKPVQKKRMTKARALLLSRALTVKMEQRKDAQKVEILIAFGLLKSRRKFSSPPGWALSAARIFSEEWAKLFRLQAGQENPDARQVGALVGMVKSWAASLSIPSEEIQKIEGKVPEFAAVRARLAKISETDVRLGNQVEEAAAKAPLSARERREYAQGQFAGASQVVDEKGELRDDSSGRKEICYFIWLYWDEIRFLRSMTDLMLFFSEFDGENISRKNLEKVCSEIGLKFKGRGRPRNPTKVRK